MEAVGSSVLELLGLVLFLALALATVLDVLDVLGWLTRRLDVALRGPRGER